MVLHTQLSGRPYSEVSLSQYVEVGTHLVVVVKGVDYFVTWQKYCKNAVDIIYRRKSLWRFEVYLICNYLC